MATYTVRLNELVNYFAKENSEEWFGLSYSQKIDTAAHLIMPESYPCYGVDIDEEEIMRENLSRAIVRHYLMREIGCETFELWKIMVETRLREIMPYYQELYKTTLFDLDLNNPYHLITTHNQNEYAKRDIDRSGDNTSNGTDDVKENGETNYGKNTDTKDEMGGESNTDTSNSHSDFPQASYEQGDYVTWSEKGNSHSNESSETKGTIKESGKDTVNRKSERSLSTKLEWKDTSKDINDVIMDYIHDVKGHTSNTEVLEAIKQWRALILNINLQIINDISDLFMRIY